MFKCGRCGISHYACLIAYIKAMEYVFNICKTECIGTKYHQQKMPEEEDKVRKAKRDIQEKLASELGIIVDQVTQMWET